ncbi:MAG: hypothetical protein ACYTFV_14475 [Planctomycetota bacterium]|jgi:hypothetical protein
MEQMLECRLDAGDEFGVARSRNLLAQLGLVMKFVLSGEVDEVTAAHEAWKAAFVRGEDLEDAEQALREALIENEEAFRAFATSISN